VESLGWGLLAVESVDWSRGMVGWIRGMLGWVGCIALLAREAGMESWRPAQADPRGGGGLQEGYAAPCAPSRLGLACLGAMRKYAASGSHRARRPYCEIRHYCEESWIDLTRSTLYVAPRHEQVSPCVAYMYRSSLVHEPCGVDGNWNGYKFDRATGRKPNPKLHHPVAVQATAYCAYSRSDST
jgi:hypothetical protein